MGPLGGPALRRRVRAPPRGGAQGRARADAGHGPRDHRERHRHRARQALRRRDAAGRPARQRRDRRDAGPPLHPPRRAAGEGGRRASCGLRGGRAGGGRAGGGRARRVQEDHGRPRRHRRRRLGVGGGQGVAVPARVELGAGLAAALGVPLGVAAARPPLRRHGLRQHRRHLHAAPGASDRRHGLRRHACCNRRRQRGCLLGPQRRGDGAARRRGGLDRGAPPDRGVRLEEPARDRGPGVGHGGGAVDTAGAPLHVRALDPPRADQRRVRHARSGPAKQAVREQRAAPPPPAGLAPRVRPRGQEGRRREGRRGLAVGTRLRHGCVLRRRAV
mmetsp:Transcript_64565/g.181674  ORF Transcript_64565/g.181674 Transcript_64565/m.181674 type:complete len:331 (+) Transcript_64565:1173-2165(+)